MRIYFAAVRYESPPDRLKAKGKPVDRVLKKDEEEMMNEMFAQVYSVDEWLDIMELDPYLYERLAQTEPIYFPKIGLGDDKQNGKILTPQERALINIVATRFKTVEDMYRHFLIYIKKRQKRGEEWQDMETALRDNMVCGLKFKKLPPGDLGRAFVTIIEVWIAENQVPDMPTRNVVYRSMGRRKLLPICASLMNIPEGKMMEYIDGLLIHGYLKQSLMGDLNFPVQMLENEQAYRVEEAYTPMVNW